MQKSCKNPNLKPETGNGHGGTEYEKANLDSADSAIDGALLRGLDRCGSGDGNRGKHGDAEAERQHGGPAGGAGQRAAELYHRGPGRHGGTDVPGGLGHDLDSGMLEQPGLEYGAPRAEWGDAPGGVL